MNIKFAFYFILLGAGLLSTGCKKESEEPTVANLAFNMDFNVNGVALEFNKDYQINGTTMRFIAANYYLGGLKITQANGNLVDFTGQYLLAGVGSGAVVNEPLPISNISNVQFFVGVDSITNAMTETDFTNRPTNDPLGMQDPSMHWSWNTGYRFLRVDGMTDTNGDGISDTAIAYHLGNNSMLKNLEFTTNIGIVAGENTLTFGFDLNKFFNGVDVTKELVTHVSDNLPLATRLRDNLTEAISVR